MKRFLHITIVAVLACSSLPGCASLASGHPLHAQSALAEVEVADGIDQGEAMRIADVYYAGNGHCGAFNSVTDGGLVWIVHAQTTFSGAAVEGFSIDKRSGTIQSNQCASYRKPADILVLAAER
jgi:hypothetical protein